jgi:hypothetical protein
MATHFSRMTSCWLDQPRRTVLKGLTSFSLFYERQDTKFLRNHSSLKNNFMQDSERNEENGYPVPDSKKQR